MDLTDCLMYFYVDESGHTGNNLFDLKQPRLYYGVLSSPLDLDRAAAVKVKQIRERYHVERLHATEMGLGRLAEIIPDLMQIQQDCDITFDLYRIEKADHAIISFYDQVFDQGINPALTWSSYWSPLRYFLLWNLSQVFDEAIAKEAWKARIETKAVKATPVFLRVCQVLKDRILASSLDYRSKELLGDGLTWAMSNPDKIGYHCFDGETVLDISPNMVGFQFVMAGIARRLSNPEEAKRVVVDQQSQFNRSQKTLAAIYGKLRNAELRIGPGMPTMDLTNLPLVPPEFCAGTSSVGLELVDLYLWIFKRWMEQEGRLPREFHPLIKTQMDRGEFDQVSLKAIIERWSKFFADLPPPTADAIQAGKRLWEHDEKRRQEGMRGT
jgi:hypothetical protein